MLRELHFVIISSYFWMRINNFPTLNFLFHLCGLSLFCMIFFLFRECTVYTIHSLELWTVDMSRSSTSTTNDKAMSTQKKWLLRFIWCALKIHPFCVIYSDIIHFKCNCYLFSSSCWCFCQGAFIRLDWNCNRSPFLFKAQRKSFAIYAMPRIGGFFVHLIYNSVKFNI